MEKKMATNMALRMSESKEIFILLEPAGQEQA